MHKVVRTGFPPEQKVVFHNWTPVPIVGTELKTYRKQERKSRDGDNFVEVPIDKHQNETLRFIRMEGLTKIPPNSEGAVLAVTETRGLVQFYELSD